MRAREKGGGGGGRGGVDLLLQVGAPREGSDGIVCGWATNNRLGNPDGQPYITTERLPWCSMDFPMLHVGNLFVVRCVVRISTTHQGQAFRCLVRM